MTLVRFSFGNRPRASAAGPSTTPASPPSPRSALVPRQAVGQRLRDLLDEADHQDADAGRAAWLARAVEQLVPDEARILHALSQRPAGSGAALVHIHCLTATGIPGEAVLENASGIGRTAQVALPDLTPSYLGRLLGLDLVEIGPEDPRLIDEYQALLADRAVLRALSGARGEGLTPRVLRHTLLLSTLGRELWDTYQPRS